MVQKWKKRICESALCLGHLRLVGQEEVNKFSKGDDISRQKEGFIKISGVVDSGSIDNVFKKDDGGWLPIRETQASRSKSYYTDAGGHKICNEGERFLEGLTNEGQHMRSKVQVGELTKSLWSVRETKKANNIVAFGLGSTHALYDLRNGNILGRNQDDVIINKNSGVETKIRDTGKEYLLDMWIKKPDTTFRRQP